MQKNCKVESRKFKHFCSFENGSIKKKSGGWGDGLMGGWMGDWMDGLMGGWEGMKASLRINLKIEKIYVGMWRDEEDRGKFKKEF